MPTTSGVNSHAPRSRSAARLSGFLISSGAALCLAIAVSGGSPAALAALSRGAAVLAPAAGTDIGNAGQLTAAGSGTIGTGSDDWWVIYPSASGAQVSVTAHNNGSAESNCQIEATLYGADGTADPVDSVSLNPGVSNTISGKSAGSDRYFVEVSPNSCPSTAPYSLNLTQGGGGTAPSPAVSSVSPGDGIGDVGAALKGHAIYNQSINFNGGTENWYVFYKKPDSNVATIRVANTTVDGSTTCAVFFATLFSNEGSADPITRTPLNNNAATIISVPARQAGDPQGQFYLQITADGFDCGVGGANYSLEQEPGAEFTSPAKVPTGKVTPAPSIGSPWPPLQGGISYKGSIGFNGGTENWYVLYKKPDSRVATLRIANTTVDGSTSCAVFFATLFTNAGTNNGQLASTPLNNNAITTMTVPARQSGDPQGVFYLQITEDGFDCGTGGANYTIEPEPKVEFASPAKVPTGKHTPNSSLRRAWPPLSGGLAYKGSIDFSGGTQNWYVLDKKSDKHAVSLQVTNTTVDGSTSCAVMSVNLFTNKGPAVTLASFALNNNASATLSIPGHQAGDPQGLFYLEITVDGFDCGTGGATYTLLATPKSEFITPALKVAGTSLKKGKLHKAYKTAIGVSEGKAPYAFIAKTKLPPGLKLSKRTGVISGKPTRKGTFKFAVEIEDSSKPHRKTVTDVFTITIS